jgi:nicotinate-nucleotide adenylyltransferase
MLELAIADKPLFTSMNANCSATRRHTPRKRCGVAPGAGPKRSLAFIIGQDSLLTFTTWHDYESILDNVHLIVCRRPGYPLTMACEQDQQWLDKHQP